MIAISDEETLSLINCKQWVIASNDYLWCNIVDGCGDCDIGIKIGKGKCQEYRSYTLPRWLQENKYPWLFL